MSVISSHIQVWIFAVLSLQVLRAPQNITAMVTVSGRRPKLLPTKRHLLPISTSTFPYRERKARPA